MTIMVVPLVMHMRERLDSLAATIEKCRDGGGGG